MSSLELTLLIVWLAPILGVSAVFITKVVERWRRPLGWPARMEQMRRVPGHLELQDGVSPVDSPSISESRRLVSARRRIGRQKQRGARPNQDSSAFQHKYPYAPETLGQRSSARPFQWDISVAERNEIKGSARRVTLYLN